MGLIKDFKVFAMRGNVVDLAVAVIIGTAFGKIVASFVADVVMPPIGLLVGGVNFTDLKWVMKAPETINGVEQAAVTMNYGNFLQVSFDFLIVAFVIFMAINGLARLSKQKEDQTLIVPPPPAPSKEELLLTEIRDLLKERK